MGARTCMRSMGVACLPKHVSSCKRRRTPSMNSAQAALRVICFHSSFSTEPKHFESTENTAASSIISRSLLSLVAVIRS